MKEMSRGQMQTGFPSDVIKAPWHLELKPAKGKFSKPSIMNLLVTTDVLEIKDLCRHIILSRLSAAPPMS